MNLTISYSLDQETQRVIWTLRDLAWYKEHGYKVALPERLPLDIAHTLTKAHIKTYIEPEYDEAAYKKGKQELEHHAPKYLPLLSEELRKLKLHQVDIYTVQLTRYGTGGSYHLPDKVILNIRNKYDIGPIKTVIHEIIHLSIQKMIEEHTIDHWVKEGIVDRMLVRIFPSLSRLQEIPIDTKPIDSAFEKYYPNIPKLIASLA